MTDSQLIADIRHELRRNTLGSTSWLDGEEYIHDKIQANRNDEISAAQWDSAIDELLRSGELFIN